ncbi:hypothetical protein WUBG_12320, partial [Wuchereria bancrofti]
MRLRKSWFFFEKGYFLEAGAIVRVISEYNLTFDEGKGFMNVSCFVAVKNTLL